jgi:hypothetical protein
LAMCWCAMCALADKVDEEVPATVDSLFIPNTTD